MLGIIPLKQDLRLRHFDSYVASLAGSRDISSRSADRRLQFSCLSERLFTRRLISWKQWRVRNSEFKPQQSRKVKHSKSGSDHGAHSNSEGEVLKIKLNNYKWGWTWQKVSVRARAPLRVPVRVKRRGGGCDYRVWLLLQEWKFVSRSVYLYSAVQAVCGRRQVSIKSTYNRE